MNAVTIISLLAEQRAAYAAVTTNGGTQDARLCDTVRRPPTILARAVREGAKARKILIDDNPTMVDNSQARISHLMEKELVEKATLAFEAIKSNFDSKVVIHSARKLPRRGSHL